MVIKSLGITVIALYVLAACSYVIYFITQKNSWKPAPSLVLAAGTVLHLTYITLLTKAVGHFPIISVFEVLTSATFLFAFFYLLLEIFIKDKSMGVLIAPILLVFQTIAVSGIEIMPKPLPSELSQFSGLSFRVHILSMLLAYVGFTVAFIASCMHLMLTKEIHQKRLGFFFSRIPSLELLDRLNSSTATAGFVFATVGMLWGCIMAMQYWGNPLPPDPKFISFFLTWCLYLFHLIARLKLGWLGERAAWLSVIGFIWVVVNLLIVSIYVTELHLYL